MEVYLQIQAAIPPGYRVQFGGPVDEDKPRLPDGRVPPRRFANNGSLASPHITNYTLALTRDLVRMYPEIKRIRYHWPELPAYPQDLSLTTHLRSRLLVPLMLVVWWREVRG